MSEEFETLDLEERLLQKTLEHAFEKIEFYKTAFCELNHLGCPTLEEFPIIDRAIVEAHFEDFLCLDRFPDFVISSGGTMQGAGVFSFRAQEEYEAVYFLHSGRHPRRRYEYTSPDGFAIDLFTHTNGYHWRKPPGLPVLPMTLEQEAHAQFIVRMLNVGMPIQGHRCYPVHIQGQCGPMRALTGYIDALGNQNLFDRERPSILVYGSHTTRVWKERYQHVWGSRPSEFYGLSEFAPGSAQKCRSCGGFHFRTCWVEFLSLTTNEPKTFGDARLVLTSLYPFVQLQPRIRYNTGDIVKVNGVCPSTGRMSFEFRGRWKHSVFSHGVNGAVLFSEIEVQETLDQMKDVACQMQVSEQRIWESSALPKPPYSMGYPRFQIEIVRTDETTIAFIRIEVTFDPEVEDGNCNRFRERFKELFFKEAPAVEEAIEVGWLNLQVELFAEATLPIRIKSSA